MGHLISREDAMQNVLKTYLRKQLSDYKIPTKWHFKETLPKTSLGKVQKRKLDKLNKEGI